MSSRLTWHTLAPFLRIPDDHFVHHRRVSVKLTSPGTKHPVRRDHEYFPHAMLQVEQSRDIDCGLGLARPWLEQQGCAMPLGKLFEGKTNSLNLVLEGLSLEPIAHYDPIQ